MRIHPVQRVINNIAQLSGRGFPCIFYMKMFLLQLYVFFCAPKWKPSNENTTFWKFEFVFAETTQCICFYVWYFEIMNYDMLIFDFLKSLFLLHFELKNVEFRNLYLYVWLPMVSGAILPPAGRFSRKCISFCKSAGLRCYPASGGSFFWKMTFCL